MALTESDVHWLLAMDTFKRSEQQWASCSKKRFINPDLCQSIDLFYKVLRRFLDSVPYTMENRCKYYKQVTGLSFLMARAENEMGNSLNDITL